MSYGIDYNFFVAVVIFLFYAVPYFVIFCFMLVLGRLLFSLCVLDDVQQYVPCTAVGWRPFRYSAGRWRPWMVPEAA